MFVQEDFKRIRIVKTNKLQCFPANALKANKPKQKSQRYENGYLRCLKGLVKEFASNCSMHGMYKIFQSSSNVYKRITWIVGFLSCLIVLVYVSYRFAKHYHTTPLQTVVATTHLPVFRIPFPEVTICNRNRFNWQRFEMAKRVFLQPRHYIMPQYHAVFMEVLNAYDTLSFGRFYKFQNLIKIPSAMLQELSYINFQSVAEFMAWKCHEIFSICKWLNDEYSCCDIFFLRNSLLGSCLAFNTIESLDGLEKQRFDTFWPWRTKGQGTHNGLALRIHLREQNHSPRSKKHKGILVMLAEPPVWYSYPIKVNTHTITSIAIKATLNTYSNETRILSPEMRKCLFQDEIHNKYFKTLPGRAYMFENCHSQCQLEYLVKFCNCSVGLFYPPGPSRPCRLADFSCLFHHNNKFHLFEHTDESEHVYNHAAHIMKCKCYYNCNSLDYATTVTTAYMSNKELDFNNSFIDLHVFFQQEFITVFLTTVIYTLTDLMASFGGLAGLCIGCSLLSLVEIGYFFMIDIPYKTLLYFRARKHLRLRRKSRAVKVNIMNDFLKN